MSKGGSSGSGTNTVVQNSAPPPQVMANYTTGMNAAQTAASNPLVPYSGGQVAPFTPMQNAGLGGIQGAQGAALPFIQQGAQYAATAAQGVNPSVVDANAIQQYESPYTQQVVHSTEAELNNQNAQQQQGLAGNAISSGAWGGNRAGVAQGIMAGQQQLAEAPTIANLENQGYAQAEQEANTQQQVGLGAQEANAWLNSQAAYGMGQLGQEAQGSELSGANAELQGGALQQQQLQEELNVPYQQYEAAQAYPFQTSQWFNQQATGLGSGMGGTSSTTQPAPSTLSQLGGLGLSGVSLLGATGGFGANGYLSGLLGGGAGAAGLVGTLGAPVAEGATDASLAAMGGLLAARGGRIGVPGLAGFSRVAGHGFAAFPARGFDVGGGVTAGATVANGTGSMMASPMGAYSPNMQSLYQSYAQLPTEKLMELSASAPPNSPLRPIVQQVLRAKQMQPQQDVMQSAPQVQPGVISGPAPMGAAPQQQQGPQGAMRRGGALHRDYGGPAEGDAAPADPDPGPLSMGALGVSTWGVGANGVPSNADPAPPAAPALPPLPGAGIGAAPPVSNGGYVPPAPAAVFSTGADGSGASSPMSPSTSELPFSTPAGASASAPVSAHAGRAGMPDESGSSVNPWMALLSAGLGMMSGTSPFAGVNIGRGGLAGVQNLMQQQNEAPRRVLEQQQTEGAQLANQRSKLMLGLYGQLADDPGGVGGGGAAIAPGLGAGAGTGTAGSTGTGASTPGAASSGGGSGGATPIFNVPSLLGQAQQYAKMAPLIPSYGNIADRLFGIAETESGKNTYLGQDGNLYLRPGAVGATGAIAGAKAAATAPFDYTKSLLYRAGEPIHLAPGEAATTGFATLPPELRQLIMGSMGVGSSSGAGTPSAGTTSAPRGIQNNNPLNLEYRPGQSGLDPNTPSDGRFGRYVSMPAGVSSAAQQLLNYGSRGINTIGGIVSTWAPPNVDGNNTGAYTQFVSKAMGVSPNTPINLRDPATMTRLVGAMGQFENGAPVPAQAIQQGVQLAFGRSPYQVAQADTGVRTDATASGTSSFTPSNAPMPGVSNPTVAPPDLPPDRAVAGPPHLTPIPGGVALDQNFAAHAMQTKIGDYVAEAPKQITALRENESRLVQLQSEVTSNMRSNGWFQSGAGAQTRQDFAKSVNGTLASLGLGPAFSQSDIGNNEAFLKNSKVAGSTIARSMAGGRVAVAEMVQGNMSVPNLANTPYGNVLVGNLLLQENQRQIERTRYVEAQASRGADPTNAGQAFDVRNPAYRYATTAVRDAMTTFNPAAVKWLQTNAQKAGALQEFNNNFGQGVAQTVLGIGQQ